MAVQFFSVGSYQLNHITLQLSDDNSQIMFRFDYLEKTVLVLVCLVNILWLPIFICHIWEQNYLYEVLDEEDKQNLLAQTLESQDETKYTTEDYTKFLLATRLKNENEKRSKLEKVVLYTFIPFCIST